MGYVVIFCAEQWKAMKEQLDGISGQRYVYFHYPFEVDYRKDRELGIFHRIIVPALERAKEYSDIQDAAALLGVDGEEGVRESLMNGRAYTIPRLTVALTPRCTLRCRECNNLMWRFTDHKDLSIEKIMSSLQNVIDQFDFLPCVELIGGEPFIAHDLDKVLDLLLGEKKVLSVELTTNATILPSDEVMDRLRHRKVSVHVSDYGNVVDQGRFIEHMQQHKVQYRISGAQERWIATGGTEERGRGAEELIRQYYRCVPGNLCKTLWEDRIYPCARAASLAALGIMQDCPYIDCSVTKGLRERLLSFYVVPTCGPCDRCDVASEDPVYVQPAVQLER